MGSTLYKSIVCWKDSSKQRGIKKMDTSEAEIKKLNSFFT